jgi:penicillin amidase
MSFSDTLPQASGSLTLKGLQGEVTIMRDRWGIPHIRARSVADAFFAQGFVHAQDRLWHIHWDMRRAYGRTAELIGAAGVEPDRLMRRFQIERAAQADWALLNDETRAMVEAYTAGVNAFIERTPIPSVEFAVLGIRPEAWRPHDCLSVFKVRHVLMGVLYNKIWRMRVVQKVGVKRALELWEGYPTGAPTIVPPDALYYRAGAAWYPSLEQASLMLPSAGGSNNWVVDGTKTLSGKPLLAGDPHRAIDVPNVYYQNHLACDSFDVIGVSFPGVPAFPHLGHNSRVAWAITHAGADYQDLYIEKFDPDDASRYAYQGEWLAAEVSTERITVKGSADVIEHVRRTHHGPIIEEGPIANHAIAMRYTAFEPGKTFECFLPMARARTAHDLLEAQREWVDPAQNLIIADALGERGNIMYFTRGKLPIRTGNHSEANPPASGWMPVPGWTGEHEWNGFIPFDELPRSVNPPTHFIATANNRIVDDRYPYYISCDTATPFRYARIAEVLRSATNLTADDFAKLQADRLSHFAREFAPLLLTLNPADEASQRALALLRDWDYCLEPNSVPAMIYAATRDALMRLVMEPILGEELIKEMFGIGRGGPAHAGRIRAYLPRYIKTNDTRLLDPNDPQRASWQAALHTALKNALALLREKLGDDMSMWRYDALHRTTSVHPLSVLPAVGNRFDPPHTGYGGDGDTVQAASYAAALGFGVVGTQCYRQIIDLSDWSKSRWVVPLGASGHPDNPHYADQAPVWAANLHVPMLYDWQQIEEHAEARLVLKGEA